MVIRQLVAISLAVAIDIERTNPSGYSRRSALCPTCSSYVLDSSRLEVVKFQSYFVNVVQQVAVFCAARAVACMSGSCVHNRFHLLFIPEQACISIDITVVIIVGNIIGIVLVKHPGAVVTGIDPAVKLNGPLVCGNDICLKSSCIKISRLCICRCGTYRCCRQGCSQKRNNQGKGYQQADHFSSHFALLK